MIVVATKLDATTDRTHLDELRAYCAERASNFTASRRLPAKAWRRWCVLWLMLWTSCSLLRWKMMPIPLLRPDAEDETEADDSTPLTEER